MRQTKRAPKTDHIGWCGSGETIEIWCKVCKAKAPALSLPLSVDAILSAVQAFKKAHKACAGKVQQ